MTIVHFIAPVQFGGGEALLIDLLRCQKSDGHSVVVVALASSPRFETEIKKLGVSLISMRHPAPQTMSIALGVKILLKSLCQSRAIRLISKADANVCHAHGFPASAFVDVLTRTGALPRHSRLIYTHHFTKEPPAGIRSAIESSILGRFDSIAGCSEAVGKSLETAYPNLKDRITWVSNGVARERISTTLSREEARVALGLPEEATLGVYAARFVPQKNHISLVNLFERSEMLSSNCKIILLGEGPCIHDFETAIKQKHLESRFILPGQQPLNRIPLYLQAADFCVFPSVGEGLSIAVLEVLLSGLPTVIYRCIYSSEFGNAVLCADDEEEFSQHVEKLALDEQFRMKLQSRATSCSERWDIKRVATEYASLYGANGRSLPMPSEERLRSLV